MKGQGRKKPSHKHSVMNDKNLVYLHLGSKWAQKLLTWSCAMYGFVVSSDTMLVVWGHLNQDNSINDVPGVHKRCKCTLLSSMLHTEHLGFHN